MRVGMYSGSELQKFHDLLLDRQREIVRSMKSRREDGAPKELDQSRVGRLSRMDAMQQQAMSQATLQRQNIELGRIKTAISRIESGEYGYCIMCDEGIEEKRLLFDPSLLTCIHCAEQAEIDP